MDTAAFVKAGSSNLPKVDTYMLMEYLKSCDKHNIAELRGAKALSLHSDQFECMFENVIELCTDAAVQAAKKRPFANLAAMCATFAQYLDDLTEDEKVVILKLHPDLAGRLAAQGQLTAESTSEQRSAGLDRLTAEQKTLIDYNNEKYKTKFGFPFIICARENKVQSIIDGLQRRYNNTREQEILTGIAEVKKICKLRIMDLVKDDKN